MACSLLQLLSELHSWGENSNLLLGPRAQGFSKLHLMASGSWEEEGSVGEESRVGEGRGTLISTGATNYPVSQSYLPHS